MAAAGNDETKQAAAIDKYNKAIANLKANNKNYIAAEEALNDANAKRGDYLR